MYVVAPILAAPSLLDWVLYTLVVVVIYARSRSQRTTKLEPARKPKRANASEKQVTTSTELSLPPVPATDSHVPALRQLLQAQAEDTGLAHGCARPLGALRALAGAGVLTPPQSGCVLAELARHGNALGVRAVLTVGARAGVPIDNEGMNALLQLLCREDAAVALELSAPLTNDYYLEPETRQCLAGAALRRGSYHLVDKLLTNVATARAYALRIHALGSRGAITQCLDLFEEAEQALPDVTVAWNSLVASLVRNGRVNRAVAVRQRGGRLSPAVARALRTVTNPPRPTAGPIQRRKARCQDYRC